MFIATLFLKYSLSLQKFALQLEIPHFVPINRDFIPSDSEESHTISSRYSYQVYFTSYSVLPVTGIPEVVIPSTITFTLEGLSALK